MPMPCVGCAQSGNPASTVGTAVAPINPYAAGVQSAPAVSGPVSDAAKPCCGDCAGNRDNIWRDILTALIVSLIVGGLFFGRSK